MSIIDISIKRPVLTITFLLAFVVFGLLAFASLPMSLFPDIKAPYVTVQTIYPGASPLVVEAQITKKIEDAVSSIADLDRIISTSMENVSIVTVEFTYGKDENVAVQEVKNKVDALIANLPSDVERPSVSKVDISSMMPVMSIVLEGDMTPSELRKYASSIGAVALAQVGGVGAVEISGGQEREINVILPRETVFERSIPVLQIASVLASQNVELPGGNVNLAGKKYPVRMRGEFQSLEEIRNIDVATAAGTFKLRQIADVADTAAEVTERTVLLDNERGTRNDDAILLQVIKNPTANTIDVVKDVKKAITSLVADQNGSVTYKVIKEDATFVHDTVNDTLGNVYLGILFTGLVLLLFLHDLRSTIIVALAMPFSIIATFLVMKAVGIGLNILSLMGLSSATGTLVANSVVVLENIFRHKELGHSREDAAAKGTKEVVMAVIASTLTNVAVFVPLANMSGVMGATLADFALTIVIATVFSIVVSFTLTPLMASRILPETAKKDGRIGVALEGFFKGLENAYRASLAAILRKRRRGIAVVAGVIGIFVVSAAGFSKVQFELMPTTDGGKVSMTVELPEGSDLQATAEKLLTIERTVAAYPEVASILTTLGSAGSAGQDVNLAKMDLTLIPKNKRSASNSEIAARAVRDLSRIPGADIRVTPVSEISMDTGAAVSLTLRGPDADILMGLAAQVERKLRAVPGTMNVTSGAREGKSEIIFSPFRKAITDDGLTVQGVALALRSAVDGIVATTYKEGGEEYDVRVRMSDANLLSVEDLRNIPVVTATGTNPLSRYASLEFSKGFNRITRTDKKRTVTVSADLIPGYSQGMVLNSALASVEDIEMPHGYSVGTSGMSESLQDTVTDLLTIFVIAVILTYMLLSAILESFVQPLFILATVPLSIIGVVVSSIVTGAVLNFVAMLGIIMLVGIVVNNAILMLDYYNQLRRAGAGIYDALLDACPTKLKPILMSNIAIILGMMPMALGIGASGAEMRQPMGIVIIGGILSSTLMTLWVIPAFELLLSRPIVKRRNKGDQLR